MNLKGDKGQQSTRSREHKEGRDCVSSSILILRRSRKSRHPEETEGQKVEKRDSETAGTARQQDSRDSKTAGTAIQQNTRHSKIARHQEHKKSKTAEQKDSRDRTTKRHQENQQSHLTK